MTAIARKMCKIVGGGNHSKISLIFGGEVSFCSGERVFDVLGCRAGEGKGGVEIKDEG